MTPLTDNDREIIRTGVMSALAHVAESQEDGFIAMIKEGRAGTRALKDLPEPLREAVLGDFSTPEDYTDPETDDMQGYVRRARDVVAARTPALTEEFCRVVVDACQAVAEAAKGVSDDERRAVEEVRAALA